MIVPVFELRYEEEAKDHFVKVTDWLKRTGMDAEWEIVLPKPNQLLLDFDIPKEEWYMSSGFVKFCTAARTLQEAYNLNYDQIHEKWTTSKSGNCHCIITLPENIYIGAMETAAWQSVFGSDPKREALHIKSIVLGSKNPNLLIERKHAPQPLIDGRN